jgi:hypothetical protein
MSFSRPWTSGDVVVYKKYSGEHTYGVIIANTSYALDDIRYWTLKAPHCSMTSYIFPLIYNAHLPTGTHGDKINIRGESITKLDRDVESVVIEISQAYEKARLSGYLKYDDLKSWHWMMTDPISLVKIWQNKEQYNTRMWPIYVPPFLYQ